MKRGIILFFLFLRGLLAQSGSGLALTEVMFYPLETNGEFVELYNLSDSSISLSKYQIVYSTNNADTIISFNNGTVLPPKHYAIIFENDYDFTNGVYLQRISDSTLVLQINNGKFGSYGMANTSNRKIFLLNEAGDTVDSYQYSANNSAGYSDEKIICEDENSAENWSNSEILHGTPGIKNSVAPRDYDLSIISLELFPEELFAENEIEFILKVKNLGRKDANNFRIKIFVDLNQDSSMQASEIIINEEFSLLTSGDSAEISESKIILESGTFNIFAEINFDPDERTENNFNSKKILICPKPNDYNDIVINEIMYKPNGDEPEWVELFNRTAKKINLKDWRFADRTSKSQIADSIYFIEPKGYLILTDDETLTQYYEIPALIKVLSLPSLNNTGDNLKLFDSLGQVIDSVLYNSAWGGNDGYSLERISTERSSNDSSNWSSSVSKNFATPGKENSVTVKKNDLSISEITVTKDYAILGENFGIQFAIRNIGLSAIDGFSVEIYHDINFDGITQPWELSENLIGEYLNSGDSLFYFEYLSDFNEGVNNYIVKTVFENDDNFENNENEISFVGVAINEYRNDLIINEIMHSPNFPEQEWIEIYNRSFKNINLKNYQIADLYDTVRVLEDDFILTPNSYFVFADDSSFIEIYPNENNYVVATLPNLNNTGDRLVLLDSLNRIIDSLIYSDNWGGNDGKSLERINSELSSVDSINWSTAKLKNGGTPGRINTVSRKDFDITLNRIVFTPPVPKLGEPVSVAVVARNIGKQNISFVLQLFEDENLDSTNIFLLETSSSLSLSPNDSLLHKFNWQIENLNRERRFIVKVIADSEQDTTNNLIEGKIAPGFFPSSLVVNEIMYSPGNGEPEWIELFNISSDSINTKGIMISDIYTTPKSVVLEENLFIKPNGYLVVAKDSLIWDYHSTIHEPVIITNFANLNNDIDGIVIKDFYGVIIDSIKYRDSWGGTDGCSLERMLANLSSNDSTNWKSSTDLELSTPGRKNSVTPFLHDLEMVSIETIPEYPVLDDEVSIKVKIKNCGLDEAREYSVKITTQTANALSVLDEMNSGNLKSGDSVIFVTGKSFYISDSAKIMAKINYTADEDTSNNKINITIFPGAKRGTILINEFMANVKEDEAEWIELYNTSNETINVSNWFAGDLFTTPTLCNISETPINIEPKDYLVITNDTSKFSYSNVEAIEVKFGTLGNTEDGIIIYDFNQKIVDSLKYDYRDWQIAKGRSLERVSFTESSTDYGNWLPSLSVEGASPGMQNSILATNPADENSVIINEIMFDQEVNNSEFVELYNRSDSDVDIGGWQLIINDEECFELSSTFLNLQANEYFIIASDSSILNNYDISANSKIKILNSTLSLSNVGESLVIIDHWGNTIDSVLYNSKWHNQNIAATKNKSLERISADIGSNEETNWSTSVDSKGATPCRVNSIFAKNNLIDNGITFNPNPFSPDNDGFEDFSIINFSLPFTTAQIRIKIFDDHGRLIRTLINNKAVASNGSIIFDGLDDDGNPLRIGMYIVFLEAVDINSGRNKSYKDVIVVARKL